MQKTNSDICISQYCKNKECRKLFNTEFSEENAIFMNLYAGLGTYHKL